MNCVWCEEEVEESDYGYLSYWNDSGNLKQGYWHPRCFNKYWERRERPWYKKLLDRLRCLDGKVM